MTEAVKAHIHNMTGGERKNFLYQVLRRDISITDPAKREELSQFVLDLLTTWDNEMTEDTCLVILSIFENVQYMWLNYEFTRLSSSILASQLFQEAFQVLSNGLKQVGIRLHVEMTVDHTKPDNQQLSTKWELTYPTKESESTTKSFIIDDLDYNSIIINTKYSVSKDYGQKSIDVRQLLKAPVYDIAHPVKYGTKFELISGQDPYDVLGEGDTNFDINLIIDSISFSKMTGRCWALDTSAYYIIGAEYALGKMFQGQVRANTLCLMTYYDDDNAPVGSAFFANTPEWVQQQIDTINQQTDQQPQMACLDTFLASAAASITYIDDNYIFDSRASTLVNKTKEQFYEIAAGTTIDFNYSLSNNMYYGYEVKFSCGNEQFYGLTAFTVNNLNQGKSIMFYTKEGTSNDTAITAYDVNKGWVYANYSTIVLDEPWIFLNKVDYDYIFENSNLGSTRYNVTFDDQIIPTYGTAFKPADFTFYTDDFEIPGTQLTTVVQGKTLKRLKTLGCKSTHDMHAYQGFSYSTATKTQVDFPVFWYDDSYDGPPDMFLTNTRQDITLDEDITSLHFYQHQCLSVDTLVTMADGSKKQLGDVQIGDVLLSWNFEKNCAEPREIVESNLIDTAKFRTIRGYYKLTFSDGTIIKHAATHRFYNHRTKSFIYTLDWEIGDKTYKEDGTYVSLVSREFVNELFTHAWISMPEYTAYFANGLLTGNSECPKGLVGPGT